jgi:cell wall-associated NlpC family hydrolase
MRKIKGISLALVIIPLLSGCMQEKISTISPSKSTTKMALNSDEQNLSTLSSNTLDNNNSTTISQEQEDKSLNHLVTLIEDSVNTETNSSDIESISNNWIELTKEDEIVETAKRFLGIKYVWAANGPNCFDCSGFTKYVFKQNGITLPRYSGHQAKVGTKVSFDELQKGDLVFFDTEKKFRGRVNHVGIYIGNGKFIHASSAKKKVIITSFHEKPFYKRRFLRGERVINSSSTYASL